MQYAVSIISVTSCVHTWIDQIDREMRGLEGGWLPAQSAAHVNDRHYMAARGQAGPLLAASGRRVWHADPPFDATTLTFSNIICCTTNYYKRMHKRALY